MGITDRAEEIIHLFFADDIMFFCEPKKRALLNIRCILMGFQAVLGLSINLAKSELMRLGSIGD